MGMEIQQTWAQREVVSVAMLDEVTSGDWIANTEEVLGFSPGLLEYGKAGNEEPAWDAGHDCLEREEANEKNEMSWKQNKEIFQGKRGQHGMSSRTT